MSEDPFAQLKQRHREMWASFGPTALFTTPVAGHVVHFAGIATGETVLDIGTGALALTAARRGAKRLRHNGATRRSSPNAWPISSPRLSSSAES
jgi:hypothetical protein